MQNGDLAGAAELFEDPAWKGSAYYQNGDYVEATDAFTGIESSDGRYNRGNSLAKLKQFQDAIKAYEQAIAMNPDNEDAIFNKELLEKMLQQQNQGEPGENDQQESDQQQDDQENQQAENEQQPSEQEQQSDESEQEQDQQEQDHQQAEQELAENQMPEDEQHEMDREEEQALQQWLRQIPDHPGGLLKNKFQRQYELAKQRGEKPKAGQVW
jgi:Ca-activated chloride channel family protein